MKTDAKNDFSDPIYPKVTNQILSISMENCPNRLHFLLSSKTLRYSHFGNAN